MTKVSKHPVHGLQIRKDEYGAIDIITPGLRPQPVASYVDDRYQHVFAAAPELLESLEALVELCKNALQSQGHSFSNFKEFQIAESIIAKAKGEQK